MTRDEHGTHIGRRGVLAGIAGTMGAVALPAGSALAQPSPPAAGRRPYPPNWPALEPYGLADTREDLWPREDNSFVLPLGSLSTALKPLVAVSGTTVAPCAARVACASAHSRVTVAFEPIMEVTKPMRAPFSASGSSEAV